LAPNSLKRRKGLCQGEWLS